MYTQPPNGEVVCIWMEDLAVKCVYVCVYARVVAVTVFFAMWEKKTTTQPVFWLCVQSMRTGGYSGVWPSQSVCIHDGG